MVGVSSRESCRCGTNSITSRDGSLLCQPLPTCSAQKAADDFGVTGPKDTTGGQSSGDPQGAWADRNLLLVALQWEQLFKALLLAVCEAQCSCCRVLSSPGGAGAVPGRLWPGQLCGLVSTGLSRALKLLVLPD